MSKIEWEGLWASIHLPRFENWLETLNASKRATFLTYTQPTVRKHGFHASRQFGPTSLEVPLEKTAQEHP